MNYIHYILCVPPDVRKVASATRGETLLLQLDLTIILALWVAVKVLLKDLAGDGGSSLLETWLQQVPS
jgi:hypothetical protein